MAAYEKLGEVAAGEGPLDELLAALQQGGTVDAEGVFTLDREKAREKMQRFQLSQPARYILELVQAAVLRGASHIRFEISATQVRMTCMAAPFLVRDFEDLYESLFARGRGSERQALRHLALGLCTAIAMNPKQVRVSGGGARGASLLMRPGSRDKFGKGGDRDYGLVIELNRRPWVLSSTSLGSTPMEVVESNLLMDLCGLSMVPIELNGMPIASGYQLPGALYWRHFQQGSARGVVAVAKDVSPHSTPTSLHLLRNGISFEKDTPPGLLPGFLALIESPSFHLDISHQRIVRNEAFAQALMLVVEQQIQLLVTSCEQRDRGPWPHPVSLLHGLLLGLLDQLGSVDPLARWAGVAGSFPRLAPPVFPEQVSGASCLIDAAVFPTSDKRLVSLRQVLADRQRFGSVAISSTSHGALAGQRPLVLLAQQPNVREIYSRVFNSRWDQSPAGSFSQNHPTRMANLERWQKLRQQPRLLSPPNLLRVTVPQGLFVGEVGVELATGNPPSVEPRAGLRLTLLHLDGVLAVHTLPGPVRGLHAILSGQFTPTELWDGVVPDQLLTQAMDQLFETLPILAAAIVLECAEALSSPEAGVALRRVVCGLFLLAGSDSAQQQVNNVLRLNTDLLATRNRRQQLIEILQTEQVASAPLFERLAGPPLSLRELEAELARRGAIASVCRTSEADSQFIYHRSRWARSLGDPELTPELIARAVPAWGASPHGTPSFVLWFDGPQEPLAQVLHALWDKPALEDVRAGLDAMLELHSVLRMPDGPTRIGGSIQEHCALTVPVPELRGELGILRDEQRHYSDGLARVWLRSESQDPTLTLCAIPAGGLLLAQVDRATLLVGEDAASGELDLPRLRRALHRALLALCQANHGGDKVPAAVWRQLARRLLTSVFPKPEFRVNYDRLCWLAVREDRGAQQAEQAHRRILALSVQQSTEAVGSALKHFVAKSADQPATAAMAARWLLKQTGGSALLSPQASTAHEDRMTQEEPGSLDFLDLFFPGEGSFAQRTVRPAEPLRALPLCQDISGTWRTVGEVFSEVQQHGDVLVVPAGRDASRVTVRRLLLSESQEPEVQQALHGLLGEFRLRSYDPSLFPELTDLSDEVYITDGDEGERSEGGEAEAGLDGEPHPPGLAPELVRGLASLIAELPRDPEERRVESAPREPLAASSAQPRQVAGSTSRSPAHPVAPAAQDAGPLPTPAPPASLEVRESIQAASTPQPAPKARRAPATKPRTSEPAVSAASTRDAIAAVNREASLWLRVTHAASSLIESLRPGQAQQSEREAKVLSSLLAEIRLIAGDHSPLLSQINLSRIRLASLAAREAVVCTPHQTLINRRHPAVQRALRQGASDPVAIWFLCAAVYTALNVFLLEVGDHDEAEFLALLCRRAEQVLQGTAPQPLVT